MREIRQFGSFRLDPERRRLERTPGEAISLGARAFDALVLLVEHAGEPVSRKTLIDALWPDTVVEENNVTQAISALRRILGEGYIVTLPGRGYQFVAEVMVCDRVVPQAEAESPVTPAATLGSVSPRADEHSLSDTTVPDLADPIPSSAGPMPSAASGASDRRAPPIGLSRRVAITAMTAVALAALFGVWIYTSLAPDEQAEPRALETEASAAAEPSIAVLPFVNVSSDADQQYFADGLSDELRSQLAGLKGLRVAGRTSSFAFKGQNSNLHDVGDALNVETVLEGAVRKSGNRLRISAELVDVDDGYARWSATYERELEDVFAIQKEIASAVVNALSPALGVDAPAADYGGTESVAAYDHFLRGLGQEAEFIPRALSNAAAEFRRAVEIDPNYGQAWAELGSTLSQWAILLPNRADELLRERDQVAERALDVAPALPMTLAVQAWVATDRRDWTAASASCSKVFAETRDPKARGICSGGLTLLGFVREALPYREAGARADPLAMGLSVTLARHYALLGMSAAAEREYERSAQWSGGNWGREEPVLYSLMGDGVAPEQLSARLAQICAANAVPAFCPDLLEAVRAPNEADRRLRALLERIRSTAPQNSYIVALFAAYFDDRDLALDALEVFAPSAPPALFQHLWYPLLQDVRADPRFKDLIREIGFADFWRKTHRWNDYCHPVGDDDFECAELSGNGRRPH